jgi:lipopolysaccharide/colanic/teichoic acid biosynthesis glycosyltransferase
MMGIAVLIWLDDGTPVLFEQRRAGKHGKPFSLFKFRTLSAEAEGTPHPAQHTTRVGAVLRRWALDELPQLWNVIRGDMNLVGPRPVLLPEARGYDEEAARRLAIRPGLTGWAQVHGRNRLSWAERMELDLWYVRNRTLLLDLWILLKTPFVLLSGQGVYGPGTDDPSASEVQSHLSSPDA